MLAIVIPYYKLTFFESTLNSLANQTNKNFNVYIGDDASPESPDKVLSKFEKKLNYHYQKFNINLGKNTLVKHWERCISLTKDENWVMILGDDDELDINVVSEFYKHLELNNLKDVVFRFSSCKIDEFGQKTSSVYENPKIESSVDFLFTHERSSLSEYIFLKENIIKYGFVNFPLAWCSDVLAVLEFSNFNKIYSINTAIVYIRITQLSISGSTNDLVLKNKASEEFSKYVINKRLYLFNKSQKLKLLYGFESAIKKNRKIKLKEWLYLLRQYIMYFNYKAFIKFIRRIFIS